MRKVLLIIEDYNELIFAETLLKKVGFDCVGLKSDVGLSDKVLSFRPDIAIVSDYGTRVKAAPTFEKMVKACPNSKLLVLIRGFLPDQNALNAIRANSALASPFTPKALIEVICQLTGLNVKMVFEKFDRLGLFKVGADESKPNGEGSSKWEEYPSKVTEEESQKRESRNQKFLKTFVDNSRLKFVDRKSVQKWLKVIRQDGDRDQLNRLDEERKDFVKALFKK